MCYERGCRISPFFRLESGLDGAVCFVLYWLYKEKYRKFGKRFNTVFRDCGGFQ